MNGKSNPTRFRIGIVGPCAAGKSTLVANLAKYGYLARAIAQEHSYVPNMWQRLTNPEVLIYLDVSYENTVARLNLNWTPQEYSEQLYRLRHARENAHLTINTNPLIPDNVLTIVIQFLESMDIPKNL